MTKPPAHVVELFQPASGGVPVYVRNLVYGLLERGWAITVAGPRDALLGSELEEAGAVLYPLDMDRLPRPFLDGKATVDLASYLRKHDVAVVHSHSTKAGFVGGMVARRSGTRLIHTPHAWAFEMSSPRIARPAYATVERILSRRRDLIVAVCEHERQAARNWNVCPDERMRVIHTGLPVAALPRRNAARAELGFAAEDVVVAWVGRSAPQKRPQDLAQLALLLGERASIVALGDGIAGSRWGTNLTIAGGHIAPVGTPAATLYAAADVLIQTSAWEGLPLAVLEGMQAGLPVVAYAVGGTVEQVVEGATGYLIEPGDVHGLADAVLELASNRALRMRMGGAGRDRAARVFRYERMLDRVEDAYRAAMGRGPTRQTRRGECDHSLLARATPLASTAV